jgi:hypothetical protein
MVIYEGGDVGWADFPDEGFELEPDTKLSSRDYQKRLEALETVSVPLSRWVCADAWCGLCGWAQRTVCGGW